MISERWPITPSKTIRLRRRFNCGFRVAFIAFDLSEEALAHAVEGGCARAGSTEEAVKDVEAVITMLPAGKHVLAVWTDILTSAKGDAIFIDCSTIDVASARGAYELAASYGISALDRRMG